MKKRILATMLIVTMVGGLVAGCGASDKDKNGTGMNTESVTESSTEVVSEDTTETTDEEETVGKYGNPSKAAKYKDKVSEKTLTDNGWQKLSSNGLTFYAPKECNTYTSENGNSSICIVGLNEDFYDDVDESTVVYGATDFYAICKIDASSTFKSDTEEEDTESTEEDTRTPIKNGVFTKGETDSLISTVLSDKEVETTVMVDNDDFIIYQLDNSAAYLGFMYGTTNILEIIFDQAAYEDIYSITAAKGVATKDTDSTDESTDTTDSTNITLESIKGKDGYLSAIYLDAYKEAQPDAEVGDVVYKAGYFMDDEKEAALIMTMTKESNESKN